MKIAIFHNLPSGGAKRALFEQVRRLSDHHDLEVYTLNTADHNFCDLRPFVNRHYVYNLKVFPLFRSPFGRLNQLQQWFTLNRLEKLSREIADEIDHNQYDIVYANPCLLTQAPVILKYLKTTSIYYIHEPPRKYYEPEIKRPYNPQGWRKKADRIDPLIKLYRSRLIAVDQQSTLKANHLLANSRYTAEKISQIYKRQAAVTYLGVDDMLFHKTDGGAKENFVLSVGAIQPHKGFDFLILSLALLPPDKRPELHLIGNAANSEEIDYLVQLARANHVQLRIETNVTNEILVQRYNQAMVVVYTPIREPFGFVPLEALACGTPVIGVQEGGVCETILDKVTGRLVDRDPKAFADALSELISNPAMALEMGRKGQEWVRQTWTWGKSISEIERRFVDFTETSKNNP